MERTELKSKVPHGSGKIIAVKAGVSTSTVSNFLNGKIDNETVEFATLEFLAEASEKRRALLNRINGNA